MEIHGFTSYYKKENTYIYISTYIYFSIEVTCPTLSIFILTVEGELPSRNWARNLEEVLHTELFFFSKLLCFKCMFESIFFCVSLFYWNFSTAPPCFPCECFPFPCFPCFYLYCWTTYP